MLPQRRGTWLRNTRYVSRGLQFMKIADKPKYKENWGIVETDSKPGPAPTHKAVTYVGKFFSILLKSRKELYALVLVSQIQVFLVSF